MGGVAIQGAMRRGPELPIVAGTGLVVAACGVALATRGVNILRPGLYLANAVLYLICWGGFELPPYLRALLAAKPQSPLRFTRAYARRRAPLVKRALPYLAAAVVFMPAFSATKAGIPLFHAYTWDPALIAADRALFGTDAWKVLQPLLGFPVVTSALSLGYHLWILLIYAGSVYVAAYIEDRGLRARYFASFFALWTVCGILLAIGFASVGPCFVGPLLGLDTFDAQMAYLRAADARFPVMVLDVQRQLLLWYESGQYGLGRGITAMPSMHVALATLFWLAIRRVSGKAGRFFAGFAVVILIGSVHLAYHYAVDGIVGGLVALAIWQASGMLDRRRAEAAAALRADPTEA